MLKIAKLNMKLNFLQGMHLPYWLGNKFRGGFGGFLREATCNHYAKECGMCSEAKECIYFWLYENKKSKRGYAAPPKPIVFVPPFFGKELAVRQNGYLDLGVLIFEDYIKYLPHLILGVRLLGNEGLKGRHNNKFTITSIKSAYSGEEIYDGETIRLSKAKSRDVLEFRKEIPNNFKVLFKTPIEIKSRGFPITLEELLEMVRGRLIRYVNEYGSGDKIEKPAINGTIKNYKSSFHDLALRSRRQGKVEFKNCYTGVVEYEVREMDEIAKWLLAVGEEIGAGPKAMFGLGHYKIEEGKDAVLGNL